MRCVVEIFLDENAIIGLINAALEIHNLAEIDNYKLYDECEALINVYVFLSELFMEIHPNESDVCFDGILFSNMSAKEKYNLLYCNRLVIGS